MDCIIEAISHRRFAKSGKKRLILGRSTSVHLHRLRRFFLGFCKTLDCDSFSDSFLLFSSLHLLLSLLFTQVKRSECFFSEVHPSRTVQCLALAGGLSFLLGTKPALAAGFVNRCFRVRAASLQMIDFLTRCVDVALDGTRAGACIRCPTVSLYSGVLKNIRIDKGSGRIFG